MNGPPPTSSHPILLLLKSKADGEVSSANTLLSPHVAATLLHLVIWTMLLGPNAPMGTTCM